MKRVRSALFGLWNAIILTLNVTSKINVYCRKHHVLLGAEQGLGMGSRHFWGFVIDIFVEDTVYFDIFVEDTVYFDTAEVK